MHCGWRRPVSRFLQVSLAVLATSTSSAWAQSGSITYLGPSGSNPMAASAKVVRTEDSGSIYIICEGAAAAGEPWDEVEASIEMSWPGGSAGPQLFYASSGGGNGSLSAWVPYGDSDEDVSCSLNVNSMNGLGSFSTGATYTLAPSKPWSLDDLQLDFNQHVGDGNYLKAEIFQFNTNVNQPYRVSASITEDFYVAPGNSNECNLTIMQRNGVTNSDGQIGDAYGNWHLQDPGQPDMSFPCPTTSCHSAFRQWATFQDHEWVHTVDYTCSDVSWTPYGSLVR